MTYTLAIVEEGLLDLTRYRTPDVWGRFYAREALGVKTWDLYDQVMGSYGGKIERLMAVGGDGELAAREDDSKSNRFKPVVKYFGPFTLDGASNEHRFVMPQYIGSVKTMLVAGYEGAYGKTDKATPVRKPLMVLATLPRVLGPEETLKLPITLFSSEKNIRDVKVEIKVRGPVNLSNGNSRSITMSGIGDQTIDFDLSVKGETGFAKIEVAATSGNYKATDVIEIEVRNPNPPVTKVQEAILEAGKTWTASVAPVGVAGTNSTVLEVSSLPPVLALLCGEDFGITAEQLRHQPIHLGVVGNHQKVERAPKPCAKSTRCSDFLTACKTEGVLLTDPVHRACVHRNCGVQVSVAKQGSCR